MTGLREDNMLLISPATTAKGILLLTLAFQTLPAVSSSQTALKNATLDLTSLHMSKEMKYALSAITEHGTTRESHPYGTLVLSIQTKDSHLLLHDVIKVGQSSPDETMEFERTIEFPKDDLFHPVRITTDVTGGGKKTRALDFQDGLLKTNDWEGKRSEKVDFENGILAYPAMLTFVPLLSKNIGDSYTFDWYLEPFSMFRKAKSGFTLKCIKQDVVKLGQQPQNCFQFSLVSKADQIETNVWVDKKKNVIVKYQEILPDGADATAKEGILIE